MNFDCEHPTRELRIKTLTNGTLQYVRQCLTCGSSGTAVKAAVAIEEWGKLRTIPPFDNMLWNRFYEEQRAEQQEASSIERDRAHAEWSGRHADYRRTEAWGCLRSKVIARANGRCEGCGEAPATQVHHLTYAHEFNELLFELVAVCRRCHEKAHARVSNA